MRRLVFVLLLWATSPACLSDKEPSPFPGVDVSSDQGDVALDDADSEAGDAVDAACDDHDDCPDEQLCFERECVDRDDALADCSENDDCPEGFLCNLDDEQCEEE